MLNLFHNGKCLFMSIRRSVAAIAGERIICVCDADDPRLEWNLIARELIWISASIKVFMMVQNASVDTRIKVQFFDQAGAQTGMMLNHKIFSFSKPTRFIDDEFIDGNLTNIMDLGSKFE